MIAAAERDGRNVTSVTTPDGITLNFREDTPTEKQGNEFDNWIARHAH
jgi:hypothetical protein